MIVVEGVVGAGKTTLGKLLAEEKHFQFMEEPYVDNPFLEKFYSDRKRYSFHSQLHFLIHRFRQIQEASKLLCPVLDRSMQGDMIFATMLYEKGEMGKEEYELYRELYHEFEKICRKPDLLVYLEVSPEEAIRRIQKRGREYEQHVDKEYWMQLNEYYRACYDKFKASSIYIEDVEKFDLLSTIDKERKGEIPNCTVMIINADSFDLENKEHRKKVFDCIEYFYCVGKYQRLCSIH